MKRNIKKDSRNKLWKRLEKGIQLSAKGKDKNFILSGKWKRFLKNKDGYKVFLVDGDWIRKNLCVYFSHGGNGMVHEFIPMNEVWIATHHYDGPTNLSRCDCKVNKKNQKISKNYLLSTIIHEICECEHMKKGKSYYIAHNLALQKEKEIGLLKDPFDDT